MYHAFPFCNPEDSRGSLHLGAPLRDWISVVAWISSSSFVGLRSVRALTT